jgi:ABC-type transport system involved in multi-copper enzyme maturation permease subunit
MAKFIGPGPVFGFEMAIAARRWPGYAARSLFVAGLLAGLAAVWWGNVAGRPPRTVRAQAGVGRRFYQAFAGTQLALALLAAPAATAGALGRDKLRGTLAHLLVTDLSAAEVVLGQLGARLVPVAATALCSFPFVVLGMLLGGIDPRELVGLMLVSLGGAVLGCSLAMALSLVGTRVAESTLLTYGIWLLLVLTPPSWLVMRRVAGLPPWPLPWWLEASSPVLLVLPVAGSLPGGTLGASARFLALALGLSAALAALATARLRAAAAHEPGRRTPWPSGWRLPGPSLDGNPVLWREWQVRRPGRWGLVLWGLYALLALGCTATIAVLTTSAAPGRRAAGGLLNALQVSAGMLLFSLSAATSLAEERARGSLDVLLTTPLSTASIVWGKWWGTFRAVPVLAVPPGLALAAVAWRHGHWSCVGLTVSLVVAYGAMLCSLGLALAVWVKRPGRAVGLCAAAHVAITVGWVLGTAMLTPRAPGLRGPGIASFSPFMATLLPTIAVQLGVPKGDWRELTGWLSFWIAADAALAAALVVVVLATFDRCVGRAREGHAARRATTRYPSPSETSCRTTEVKVSGTTGGVARKPGLMRSRSLRRRE